MKTILFTMLLMPFIAYAFTPTVIEVENVGTYQEQFVTQTREIDLKGTVLEMIEDAGFDPIIMNNVIQCESGWNPRAVGDHGESLGLFQIHQPAHNTGESVAFDPIKSTEYAIKLMQKSGYMPWSCYRILYL